jgi:hypothetical protein
MTRTGIGEGRGAGRASVASSFLIGMRLSGSLAIFFAIRRASSRPIELAYCCFFFGTGAVCVGRTSAQGSFAFCF